MPSFPPISQGNSSLLVLAAGGVFTGVAEDISEYPAITLNIFSDQDSAAGGVQPQFSIDGTTWRTPQAGTYTAANGLYIQSVPAKARYFRNVYTNGAVDQTTFQLQTILHISPPGYGGHINDPLRVDPTGSTIQPVTAGTASVVILASASRTTTQQVDQGNVNARTLTLMVNVSNAGAGSITPALQVKDSISGAYLTVWTAAAALTGNGLYAYRFEAAGSGGSWTERIFFGLPARNVRWVFTANNANAVIYSASVDKGG